MIKNSKYEFLSCAKPWCRPLVDPQTERNLLGYGWAICVPYMVILGMFISSDITQSSKQEKVSETEFSHQFEPDLDI